jgi:hypothetical protein
MTSFDSLNDRHKVPMTPMQLSIYWRKVAAEALKLLNDIHLEEDHDSEDNLLAYKLFHEQLRELKRIDPNRPFNQITMGPTHLIVTSSCNCTLCVPTSEDIDSEDSTESVII